MTTNADALIRELRNRSPQPFEEVFSHEDGSVNPPLMRHFMATRLREFCERVRIDGKPMPVLTSEFTRTLYDHIINNQGVDPAKVKRLEGRPDLYAQPAIVVECNGKHIVIDGSHRLTIIWRMGLREFKFYLVPEFIWSAFLIDFGVPDEDQEWRDFCTGRGKYADGSRKTAGA